MAGRPRTICSCNSSRISWAFPSCGRRSPKPRRSARRISPGWRSGSGTIKSRSRPSGKPNAVFGMATGSTPLGLYQELVRLHQEAQLDFSRVTTFNLDEYVGLPVNHPQSYHYFMHEHFFQHVNIPRQNINIPSGTTSNYRAFCQWYEQRITECGGIDLQILGIGSDGHIAFNEPGSSLSSRTRLKTPSTPNT